MRLVLITHSYLPERTPPQRRWQHLVAAFRRAGWEVDVVAPTPDPAHLPSRSSTVGVEGDRQARPSSVGPSGERIIRTPLLPGLQSTRRGRFLANAVHAIAAVPVSMALPRPDLMVVTIPALPTVVSGLVLRALRRTPMIVEMRDAWPDLAREAGVGPGPLGLVMERLVTRAQTSADLVVTVTRGFAERLRERGIHPVEVVGNGVDLNEVTPVPPRDREPGELHVLYLGNHGESQALETVIQAAALLVDAPEDIVVRLVGSGTRKEALAELNERLGSPVQMLDPVHGEGLQAQYAWSDTCVISLRPDWPSFAWTVPSKTYDLLAVGRHITGIVTGEAAEILQQTEADLVDPSPEALAALWRRLAQQQQVTTAGTGRAWVEQHADLSLLGDRFVDLAGAAAERADRSPVPAATGGTVGLLDRLRQGGTNLRLMAATVREHLDRDPVELGLQISRRMPSGVRARAGRLGARWLRGVSPGLSSLGLAMSGQSEELMRRAQTALQDGASSRTLISMADVLVADGQVAEAEAVLSRVPDSTPGAAQVRSRALAFRGDMSAAIQALPTGPRMDRLRSRLQSEHSGYLGQRPQLTAVPHYRPVPGRVLHVLTSSLPHTGAGYAQRTHSTLLALRDLGWDVSGVTRLGWPVQTGVLTAGPRDRVDGIEYRRLLPARLQEGFGPRLQQHAELLLQICLDERPQILHTTTEWTNAVVTRAVAEALGIPWVYEVRGQRADTWASLRGEEALSSERYRLFTEREAEAARSADAVITLAQSMRRTLLEAGVSPERLVVCPNAVGGAFLEEPLPQRAARESVGLDPECHYVGTVSSIVPYEGLDTLVDAVAVLAPGRPDLRLLIVGDGTALPSIQARAQQLGIDDRLIVTGRVDRSLARAYHSALDVFVVPRRDTSVTRAVTPMKSVESSATGRPVVASDLPALAELVHHERTGLLVPPEDPAALAQALEGLLEDRARRERLGHAGRQWAVSERTWAANAERIGELYRTLLER